MPRLSLISPTQNNPDIDFKLKSKDKFPDNFPLQIGGEIGIGYQESVKDNKYILWNSFIDINIFDKIILLRLEFGMIEKINSDNDNGYLSAGFNYRVIKEDKHRIFIHGGLGFQLGLSYIVFSSKYVYSINKFVGFTFGPRIIHSLEKNNTYYGLLLGILLF